MRLFIATLVLLTACAPEPQREPETGATVEVEGFSFSPATLEVDAGATITWTNNDAILHTATSGDAKDQGVPGVSEGSPAEPDGVFDVRLDGSGTTGSATLDRPGTYPYFCAIHAGMSGEIVVG